MFVHAFGGGQQKSYKVWHSPSSASPIFTSDEITEKLPSELLLIFKTHITRFNCIMLYIALSPDLGRATWNSNKRRKINKPRASNHRTLALSCWVIMERSCFGSYAFSQEIQRIVILVMKGVCKCIWALIAVIKPVRWREPGQGRWLKNSWTNIVLKKSRDLIVSPSDTAAKVVLVKLCSRHTSNHFYYSVEKSYDLAFCLPYFKTEPSQDTVVFLEWVKITRLTF